MSGHVGPLCSCRPGFPRTNPQQGLSDGTVHGAGLPTNVPGPGGRLVKGGSLIPHSSRAETRGKGSTGDRTRQGINIKTKHMDDF